MSASIRIAAIRPHPSRRKYYQITLDEQESLTVHEDVVVRLTLRVGTLVTEELLTQIVHESDLTDARRAALRLLEVRFRSRKELTRALNRKGYSAPVVGEVAENLENLGLVDDRVFARELAGSLLRRHHLGRQGLVYRLRQRGIGDEVAEEVVADVLEDIDESQRALAALQERLPRWRSLPAVKLRNRAYQFLARLGFEPDVISDVLRSALADD